MDARSVKRLKVNDLDLPRVFFESDGNEIAEDKRHNFNAIEFKCYCESPFDICGFYEELVLEYQCFNEYKNKIETEQFVLNDANVMIFPKSSLKDLHYVVTFSGIWWKSLEMRDEK